MTAKKLAIFSAFPQELRHIMRNVGPLTAAKKFPFELHRARYAASEIILVQTGMRVAGAEESLWYILDEHKPDVVLSAGFGGALYEGARIGDLVSASRVLLVRDGIEETMELPETGEMIRKLGSSLTVREGSVLTLAKWLTKSEVRKLLHVGLPFPVCDMEAFFLAKLSAEKGLPFLAIRSISDRADEEIPPGLLGVADESGKYRLSRALRVLATRPALIPRSIGLGLNSGIASRSLWHFVRALAETI
ncbi:MAG: hypothetical protein M1497_09800 [Nitrospirae bacterium]|nr:hypothetical protein [Nitrospirota bacterium]